ncbi:hypothetical protein BHM03_00003322, partial [Ensete ventricosum]
ICNVVNIVEATAKAIMQTMGVEGHALFHLEMTCSAYQKYIDPFLAKAYKIACEKIGLNSLSTTKRELLDMATRAICSPYDTLGVSDIHRLLVNSVKLALAWLQDDPLVRHRWLVPARMINGETPKASLQICIATDNDRGQNIALQLLIAFYC